MTTIQKLDALEILDSRGRPTLEVACKLSTGVSARAQVPSGASTGKAEAVELRDGETDRYAGLGCRKAVSNVLGPIANTVCGRAIDDPSEIDRAMITLDGTPNKSKLGANAILGVSLAVARASARDRGLPLYEYLSTFTGELPKSLPRITINLFSGGKHAGGQVPVQDVLLVPRSASTIADGLEMVCATYRAAAELIQLKYGARLLTADEGGLAPPFTSVNAMLDDTVAAMEAAGLRPSQQCAIAMDVAASHFYENQHYCIGDQRLLAKEMIDLICTWAKDYPIVSLEDALAEDDWDNWPRLKSELGPGVLTLGDDLLCTNPERIQRAIDSHCCNALLLKVNQIGTLTEAAEALRLARSAGWDVTISARSGETEDDWLADLAVGWNADQIKVGSVTQSERLAKYNRLLAIESETQLPVVDWPNSG